MDILFDFKNVFCYFKRHLYDDVCNCQGNLKSPDRRDSPFDNLKEH